MAEARLYLEYECTNSSSQARLYSDKYGTPYATGDLVDSWSGSGQAVVWTNGTPDKRSWTEQVSGSNGITTVRVYDAGTPKALVAIGYQGDVLYFDASNIPFNQMGFQTGEDFMGPPTDRRPPADPDYIPVLAKLQILSEPTDSTDAATKAYVDTQSGGVTDPQIQV